MNNKSKNTKLRIVADHHIWGAESAFSALAGFDVDLRLLDHQDINHASLINADILLTRSSTQVNAALLADTAVRFVATATIGDDHYDKIWLDAHGITWANAAGSSTASVLEYMLTTLLDLQSRRMLDIPQACIGIIGAGRIGSALAKLCIAMGMRVLLNDPPRAREEGDAQFCSLDEVLAEADILSMHTPLIHRGVDCTVHLLSRPQLAVFKGKGIINTGRGSCLDNALLCAWLDEGYGRFAVLDCWEHEPRPLPYLIKHPGIVIATPHIAGHSIEGKAANTQFIYNALCQFLNITPTWDMHNELPAAPACLELANIKGMWPTLHAAVTALYPIANDDMAMRHWAHLSSADLAKAFTTYRRHYPVRRGWQHAPISMPHADAATVQMAEAMGIKVV